MVIHDVVKAKQDRAGRLGSRQKSFFARLLIQKELVILTLPFFLLLIVFSYIPLWGWVMAFQNFKPYLGVFNSTWVGFKNFVDLFKVEDFYLSIRNTLGINILRYITYFFATITLALLINEVRCLRYKKTVQVVSYLPHFVSWVVAASIVYNVLSPDGGIVNDLLMKLGIVKSPIGFMGIPGLFWPIVAVADIWKEVGWGTIIYLAAVTSIDSELYDAASIDGASRIGRIFAVTLPGMMSVIKIVMILNVGYLLSSNFEQIFLLQNPTVSNMSRTLDIYVYQYGIQLSRYSFATAAGIFSSVVALTLVTFFNRLSRTMGGERAF